MPNFKIEPSKKQVVEKVTFDKKEDFKVVNLKLKNRKGEDTGRTKEVLLHRVQAEKLIKEKKATEVKGAKVKNVKSNRTVQVIEETE